MLLPSVIAFSVDGFTTNEAADDVEAFYEATPCPAASLGISQAVEGIRSRAATITRESEAIAAYCASWTAAA